MVWLFYSSRIKDIYVEKRRQLITNFFDNILPVNIATASAVRSIFVKGEANEHDHGKRLPSPTF